ncbi:predicted protein [Aspergillus terreus NIH2624]|uniref:N-acetyltransferase domain-containing protein n=1 Tax=Aspergillus terreus (strain NIH 2624 / FGSC A1156) TaxID=341663 RepID=Q0CV98_ASPTN|nr:uncharacterized protein ATEG_02386 [Aspergillus terreus NIH2624]EAU37348.1 predicted protein [Aspergillus terreus NIH2624]
MALLPEQAVRVQIPDTLAPIRTQRLLLRPLADSDADDLFAIRSRPEVARTNYPKTPHQSVQETREWMATKIFTEGPEDMIGRHFTYVLTEHGQSEPETERLLTGGRVIGYVGINEVYPSPEIGYSIHPDVWGKGYATEALEGLLKAWWEMSRSRGEDVDEGVERVFAICEKANAGSSRVLSKCGFRVFQEMAFEEDELFLWELERPGIDTC